MSRKRAINSMFVDPNPISTPPAKSIIDDLNPKSVIVPIINDLSSKPSVDPTIDDLSQILDDFDLDKSLVKCRRCGDYHYIDDDDSSSDSSSSMDSTLVQLSPKIIAMTDETDDIDSLIDSKNDGLPNRPGSGQT